MSLVKNKMNKMNKIDEVKDEQWIQVNEKNRKITEEFLRESTQLSPQTLKQYNSALRIYFNWIRENANNKNFYELKARDYLMYQNFLVRNGMSSSGIKFKRSAVSSLNNYVELYYADEYKDFRQYVTKAIATPPPQFVHEKEPLTMEEYNNLCSELEKKEMWQQLAYIKFSFASGARRAEVGQLLKEVVNYEPKILKTEKGDVKTYQTHNIRCKGRGIQGKIRKLQFDEPAKQAVEKWLLIRGDDDCSFVFVVKKDGKYQKVSESTFNSWANNHFEEIVGRRFHPHLIRETRATTMVMEQGKDIKSAQKLLDHKSSVTTEIYVIRKDEDNADDAFI